MRKVSAIIGNKRDIIKGIACGILLEKNLQFIQRAKPEFLCQRIYPQTSRELLRKALFITDPSGASIKTRAPLNASECALDIIPIYLGKGIYIMGGNGLCQAVAIPRCRVQRNSGNRRL